MRDRLSEVRHRFDTQAGAYAATMPPAIRSNVQAVGDPLAGRRLGRALDVGSVPGTIALLVARRA